MKKRILTKLASMSIVSTILLSAVGNASYACTFEYNKIIETKYDDAKHFSEELAAVKVGEKWGYVDKVGRMVIEPTFDIAAVFNEGKAVVGYAKGHHEAFEFIESYELGFIDKTGKYTKFDHRTVPYRGRMNGDEDYRYEFDLSNMIFNNGYISLPNGLLDLPRSDILFNDKGKSVTTSDITTQSDVTGENSSGISIPGRYKNGKLNPIGDEGNYRSTDVFPLSDYSRVSKYNEGLFPATNQLVNLWFENEPFSQIIKHVFFCDESLKKVIDFPSVEDLKGNGKTVTYAYSFNQGLAPVYQSTFKNGEFVEGAWGFIDKSGKMVIEAKYDNFYMFDSYRSEKVFNDGIASVKNKSGMWGGINKKGETVIPFQYKEMKNFNEGVAPVKFELDDDFSYIDTKGHTVIDSVYDRKANAKANAIGDVEEYKLATPFNDGLAAVYDGKDAYLIDRCYSQIGQKIEGTEKLNKETYFPNLNDESRILAPTDHIVIKEDNKYGFAKLTLRPGIPDPEEMAKWAYEEVLKAIENDLVPRKLQNQYESNIIRSDFATLIVKSLEEASEKSIEDLVLAKTGKTVDAFVSEYPFKDTVDRDIIAANALGIIKGVGNNTFDAYSNIRRQDAATLLMRAANVLELNIEDMEDVHFTDQALIDSYALEAISYISSLQIMEGTGNDKFSPKEAYTRQQAYMTIYRLFDRFNRGHISK